MPRITANGAELYYEVRGIGPSLLLIPGGGADAGHVARFAGSLVRDFTVVAYDRRGLSRSPRPEGWSRTSITEQAEDAAGLVNALGLAPAAVVGHSLGALIGLELLLRHPELVRQAVLIDAGPIDSAIADRQQRMVSSETVRAAISRGPRPGFEALLRHLHIWDNIDEPARERALGNAEVFFSHETPLLQTYQPDGALLGANRVPVRVCAGKETPAVFREMADWLALKLSVRVEAVPGGHASCIEQPDGVADVIRPLLLSGEQARVPEAGFAQNVQGKD
jgi:pimeloyl-ACP methyl ester carboxylesterase